MKNNKTNLITGHQNILQVLLTVWTHNLKISEYTLTKS